MGWRKVIIRIKAERIPTPTPVMRRKARPSSSPGSGPLSRVLVGAAGPGPPPALAPYSAGVPRPGPTGFQGIWPQIASPPQAGQWEARSPARGARRWGPSPRGQPQPLARQGPAPLPNWTPSTPSSPAPRVCNGKPKPPLPGPSPSVGVCCVWGSLFQPCSVSSHLRLRLSKPNAAGFGV